MKKLLLFIIVLLESLAGNAMAYDIVVVKSGLSKINEQVEYIITQELAIQAPRSGLKSIHPHQVINVVIDKDETNGNSAQKIRNAHPDLILALGAKALTAALAVADIPIVYLLVINPEKIIRNRTNITGISLTVPPGAQFEEVRRYLPQVKRVGVVYDPKRSSKVLEQIRAARPDLQFVSLTAKNTAEVPALLNSLRGQVDLLWMLPDITVTNQKTLPSYFLFSLQNKIPLLSFSEKFLKHGATIAVTFDLEGMAVQAVELALEILAESQGRDLPMVVAPRVKTLINHKIATKLHIVITEEGQSNE